MQNILRQKGNEESLSTHRIILSYLQSQVEGIETSRVQQVDLVQIWHQALNDHAENLFSATAGCLALLLKVISNLYDFIHVGNVLCEQLLHEDNLPLFEHGLSASRSREHLISPCLRLLKEISAFDGGKAANLLYRARHVTFQRFDIFLTIRNPQNDHAHGHRRLPSIRSTAIDYLLFNITLQSERGKIYILNQRRWMQRLFQGLPEDPSRVVLRVCTVLKSEVAENQNLSVSLRGRLFDISALDSLVQCFTSKEFADQKSQDLNVRQQVYALLHSICASPQYSIPAGAYKELHVLSEHHTEVESSEDEDVQQSDFKVNSKDLQLSIRTFADFLVRLRPQADLKQAELILACFRTCPELVDEYFAVDVPSFLDPHLTASWIGYAHFLLSFIQEPLQRDVIYSKLEASSIPHLLDHILPPVLTQKTLTKCINQSNELITFMTIRLLIAGFQKLKRTEQVLLERSLIEKTNSATLYFNELKSEFCKRCPKTRHLNAQLKGCPEENIFLRECIMNVIDLYHQTSPDLIGEEDLDVSALLYASLSNFMEEGQDGKDTEIMSLELNRLIRIARWSAGTRWWHKPGMHKFEVSSVSRQQTDIQQKQDHSQH